MDERKSNPIYNFRIAKIIGDDDELAKEVLLACHRDILGLPIQHNVSGIGQRLLAEIIQYDLEKDEQYRRKCEKLSRNFEKAIPYDKMTDDEKSAALESAGVPKEYLQRLDKSLVGGEYMGRKGDVIKVTSKNYGKVARQFYNSDDWRVL